MAYYPESPIRSYPVTVEESYRTLVTQFESGREQRVAAWAFPRRRVTIRYKVLTHAEVSELWSFYRARRGAYEPFLIYTGLRTVAGEYVAVGDGASVQFDLPGRDISEASLAVYVDGIETAVTFIPGGGALSDRVQFAAAPAEASVISADFEGDLLLMCRYEADAMSAEMFSYLLYSSGVTLIEVKA